MNRNQETSVKRTPDSGQPKPRWKQDILLWEKENELLAITLSEKTLEASRLSTAAKLLEL